MLLVFSLVPGLSPLHLNFALTHFGLRIHGYTEPCSKNMKYVLNFNSQIISMLVSVHVSASIA